MTKALEQALEVIEGRIRELQQDDELTRLLGARAAILGEDAPPLAVKATDEDEVATLTNQRDALREALNDMRSKRDALAATVAEREEVIETQRTAISNLRKQLTEATGKHTPVPPVEKKAKAEPKAKAKPGPKPGSGPGRRAGFNEFEPPLPDDVLTLVRENFKPGVWTKFGDILKVAQAKWPDANKFKVKNRLTILRSEGRMEHNGATARGSRWRLPEGAAADDKEAAQPAGPAELPTAIADVHRFVRDQREPFSIARVMEATSLPREVALALVEDLVERGIATDISPSADMRLFEYRKPTEAGAAAELDASRRTSETNGGETSEPVAGTGRGPRVRNKELQALIDTCIRVGAKVLQAGNGHFAVNYNGKRTLISSTPSNPRSVLNDRTRLRRAGVPV